jgi:lysophospholipase L1-like esterase
MSPSRLVKKLSISLASVVLFLVLAEACVRLCGYEPVSTERLIKVGDANVHYRYAPRQDVVYEKEGREYRVRINSLGHRGEDFPLEKPPGEYRIFGIGDSMADGPGVDDGDTFYARLGALYAGEGRAVRVINAGVSGYSTYHYRRWAEHEIARYGSDAFVVALYTGNDNVITATAKTVVPVPWQAWKRWSALVVWLDEVYRDFAWKRIQALKQDKSFEQVEDELEQYRGMEPQHMDEQARLDTWTKALEHVAAIRAVTLELGLRFAVLLLPTCTDTEPSDRAKLFNWLKDRLGELGVDVIDPLDALRAVHPQCWLPYDPGHFDRPGHEALARVLHDELAKLGIPPAE